MKVLLVLLTWMSLSVSKLVPGSRKALWNQFKVDFDKSYESLADEVSREQNFMATLKTVVYHNFEFRRGRTTFKMGINKFADMTFEEYSEKFTANETIKKLSRKRVKGLKFKPEIMFALADSDKETVNLPHAFDWRNFGAVTEVKDQEFCGACYAMSALGALESHHFIAHQELVQLSEQEIIDCAQKYNSFQCAGGIVFRVFDYVKDKGGLSADADYPFEGKAGECRVSKGKVRLDVKGYGFVRSSDDVNVLKKAVAEIGPMVVSLDLNHESFMRYSSGIFYDDDCTQEVNHGALLVGYGSENGVDYWIIKNSFGEQWGESGYIRMAIDKGADCGVSLVPMYPILNTKAERGFLEKAIQLNKHFSPLLNESIDVMNSIIE